MTALAGTCQVTCPGPTCATLSGSAASFERVEPDPTVAALPPVDEPVAWIPSDIDAFANAATAWSTENAGTDWSFNLEASPWLVGDLRPGGLPSGLGPHYSKRDGRNSVAIVTNDFVLSAPAIPDHAIAFAISWNSTGPSCSKTDCDISINVDHIEKYESPQLGATSDKSLTWTLAHELGHCLGFSHWDGNISLMNSLYPAGGDPGAGGQWRLNADEYISLRALKPGAGSGTNAMLYRWRKPGSTAVEVWTPASASATGADLTLCEQTEWQNPIGPWCGVLLDDHVCEKGPLPIVAAANSTEAVVDTYVDYYLVAGPGASCSGDEYHFLGSRFVSLVPGVLEKIDTALIIPCGAPPGSYTVCAVVDAEDALGENPAARDDNVIYSEFTVNVAPHTSPSCPHALGVCD
ncbi:MAG: hypothetical protein ACI9K5_003600 [Gammaproteobacteria bacterium]